MDIELSSRPLSGLLALYGDIPQELVRRKVCRSTNNPAADLAESLVVEALGLSRATKSTKGYDAVDTSGRRYEIKSRRVTRQNPSRLLSVIRDLKARHFHFLAGVLFREDFSFDKACLIPFDIVLRRSKYKDHVNGHLLELKDDLWQVAGVTDISPKVAAVLASFDTRSPEL